MLENQCSTWPLQVVVVQRVPWCLCSSELASFGAPEDSVAPDSCRLANASDRSPSNNACCCGRKPSPAPLHPPMKHAQQACSAACHSLLLRPACLCARLAVAGADLRGALHPPAARPHLLSGGAAVEQAEPGRGRGRGGDMGGLFCCNTLPCRAVPPPLVWQRAHLLLPLAAGPRLPSAVTLLHRHHACCGPPSPPRRSRCASGAQWRHPTPRASLTLRWWWRSGASGTPPCCTPPMPRATAHWSTPRQVGARVDGCGLGWASVVCSSVPLLANLRGRPVRDSRLRQEAQSS